MAKRINTAKWFPEYQRWQIKVRKEGQRRTFTSSTPGRKGQLECHGKADAWLESNIVDHRMKVWQLYEQWLEEIKETTSYSHWVSNEKYGRLYIKKTIWYKRIEALTEQDLQKVILYAHKNPAKEKPLSAKYLSNIRSCLMAFIGYARKNGLTALRPESLSIPKDAHKKEKNIIQPDELKVLFSSDTTIYNKKAIKDWYIHMYRFAVVVGLRPGELKGLKWSDIHNGWLSVNRAINVYGENTSGKNKGAQRSFKLPVRAQSILEEQKKMLRKESVISPWVFPNRRGKETSQNDYYRAWTRYRKYNSITATAPYELRHTFFSLNKTLPLELVKLIGGHSKSFDTMNIYGHELTSDADLAASMVDEVMASILDEKPH